jgi:hypothetical protein
LERSSPLSCARLPTELTGGDIDSTERIDDDKSTVADRVPVRARVSRTLVERLSRPSKASLGGLLLLATAASVSGGVFDSPVDRAIATAQTEARDQNMPAEFFGVPWLTPTAGLVRMRPNVIRQGDDVYAEAVLYGGREASISYYVKGGNVLMYVFTFTNGTTTERFRRTHSDLDRSFGPMSGPKDEVDEYGQKRCSHRRTLRFAIDHCVRLHGQTPVESLVFFKIKPS